MDLPEDLLEEILCRVPATYLKRFGATCKRWNALLKDQRFTETHFRKAPKKSQALCGLKNRLKICSLSGVDGCDEVRLTDPFSVYEQFEISEVFHCRGLLLCTGLKKRGLVVCNPCTRQARRIQLPYHHVFSDTYTLGTYQDMKSNNISYKILRCHDYDKDKIRFQVYEFGSNSWRFLDNTHDYDYKLTRCSSNAVSLKGKTYWVSCDRDEITSPFLVSFDYTQERFGRMRLPFRNAAWTMSLSVVGEEKISIYLRADTFKREIWVANKNDEWNKVLTMDTISKHEKRVNGISFLFDEEKKVFMCCERRYVPYLPGISVVGVGEEKKDKYIGRVYVVGEDKEAKRVNGEAIDVVYDYVPSLVQIP